MIVLIYITVIFTATLLGALAGLGGGVIIKPILDVINYHNVTDISFLSTAAVTSMALISVYRQKDNVRQVNLKVVILIAGGSMVGGNIGNYIFNQCLYYFSDSAIQVLQAIIMNLLLIFVIISVYNKYEYIVNGTFIYSIIGLVLGITSSFLGIGGGPINVAVFTVFLGVDIKMATLYSIITILFSQVAKLFNIAFTTGFSNYDLSALLYIIPAAIVGGVVGSYLNRKVNKKTITKIFVITVISIISINFIVLYLNIK